MILVDQVTRSYGSLKVIDRFSLQVPTRSSIAVTGPSGCGKTTLLRLIAGLEMPDEGKIFINGTQVSGPGWAIHPSKREIGFVFQSPALWPHMTVAQNILFGLQGYPMDKAKQRLDELLAKTSLTGLSGRYPHQISGGEARRVGLARALAPKPRCLLLDEPLTNLDQELKEEMLYLIKESLRESDACSIYVTHDASEAAQISESVLILKKSQHHP